jgi:hypothetical protein
MEVLRRHTGSRRSGKMVPARQARVRHTLHSIGVAM